MARSDAIWSARVAVVEGEVSGLLRLRSKSRVKCSEKARLVVASSEKGLARGREDHHTTLRGTVSACTPTGTSRAPLLPPVALWAALSWNSPAPALLLRDHPRRPAGAAPAAIAVQPSPVKTTTQ